MTPRAINFTIAGLLSINVLLLALMPFGHDNHRYVVDLILITIVVTAFLNRKWLYPVTLVLIVTHIVFDSLFHYEVPLKLIIDSLIQILMAVIINYLLVAKEYTENKHRKLLSENDIPIANHRVILDKSNKPINYKFIYVNEAMEQLLGKPRKQILGKTVRELFPHMERYWIDELCSVALTQQPKRYENYAQVFNKWLSVSVYSPKKGEFATMTSDITDLKNKERALEYTIRYDNLTQLPNRYYFNQKINKLDQVSAYPLGIVYIDINGLKLINDSFGLDAGNEALKQVAVMLKQTVNNNTFIARLGGDEFVLLCPNTSIDDIEAMKLNVYAAIEGLVIESIPVSLAIGYEIKTSADQDILQVLRAAEDAMYKNKVIYNQSASSHAILSIFSTLTNKYHDEKIHSERVSDYCRKMGTYLKLDDDALSELELAGKLHDIGKISIPDAILKKAGPLSEAEWKVMKEHTINGYQILRAADEYSDLAEYALTHHERIDGLGYPKGLKGDDIPLFSRIIAVADAFEAMTAERPYRSALSTENAVEELLRCKGTQFDQNIVTIFVDEIIKKA